MTESGSLDYERAPLEAALRTINAARLLGSGEAGRVEGLLGGLEALLAAGDGLDERDRDGGGALAELDRVLSGSGAGNARLIREFLEPTVGKLIDALLGKPDERLASYGSLRPGEVNHHYVSDLVGRWRAATVVGRLYPGGGEGTRGFPGLVWDPDGGAVEVLVFESSALPNHWSRLDDFEGPGYRRLLVPADTPEGLIVTSIYEIVNPPGEEYGD